MSKSDPVAEYQQALEAFVNSAAADYARLPVGDFQAHQKAIALAERQRDDDGKKKTAAVNRRLQTMSNAEFHRRSSFNQWDDLDK